MIHFEMNKDTKDGIKLYIQGWEADQAAKGVVCLVHGLGEHSGRYVHVAAALNMAGYHMVAIDLRGHGKSTGKRGDIRQYDGVSQDVSLLLAETASRYPGLPLILYGHSLGGIIVLYYGLRFKPKLAGVVVSAPGLRTALEQQKGKVLMAKVLGSILPGMTLSSGLDAHTISSDPRVVENYQKDALVHDKVTLGFAKHSLDAIRYIFENGESWELPVLLMHGTKDVLGYANGTQEFARLVQPQYVTLRLWEGLAHELHNEPEKEQVFAYLTEQLDRFVSWTV